MHLIYAALLALAGLGAMALLARLSSRHSNRFFVANEVTINIVAVAITFVLYAAILLTGVGIGDLTNSLPLGLAGTAIATVVLVPVMVLATRTRREPG